MGMTKEEYEPYQVRTKDNSISCKWLRFEKKGCLYSFWCASISFHGSIVEPDCQKTCSVYEE